MDQSEDDRCYVAAELPNVDFMIRKEGAQFGSDILAPIVVAIDGIGISGG